MIIVRTLCLLVALFLTVGCAKTDATVSSYLGFKIDTEKIDTYLQQQLIALEIPGLSIAFINDGKVVHYKTLGYANVQDRVAVSEQTIFEGASLSKPVFAYFVMKYVQDGRLDLDRPLHTYLPYPDIAYDERYKKITARMVLSHQSGFPNWRSDYPENKLFIKFEPGTDYFYSGEGYQYLAEVLKHIENTDWKGLEKAFQEKVAQPLGLKHTVFIQDSYTMANKAEPYDKHGNWISPEKDTERMFRYQFRAPASIHSESLDFSKWLIGVMNEQGLHPESFNELFSVHSYVGEFDSIDVDYTLGFFKPRVPLTNIVLHGGNNYGFTSFFAMDPDKKWGFVVFTNSEYGEELGNELLLYLLAGPNLSKLYVVIGIVVTLLFLSLFLTMRFLMKKYRSFKQSVG